MRKQMARADFDKWLTANSTSGEPSRTLDGARLAASTDGLRYHAALNEGIAASRGRYVCFLNSDDQYVKTRVAACVAAAAGAERFVFTAVRTIDDSGRSADPDLRIQVIHQILSGSQRATLPSLSFGFLAHQVAISTGNMFVARTLLDRAGAFAPLRYCHDWDMAMRLIQLTEPVYVPQELYLYRYHGSNSSKSLLCGWWICGWSLRKMPWPITRSGPSTPISSSHSIGVLPCRRTIS